MTVVLDASAVLAVLQQERGSEAVVPLLSGACICAVNYAEVVTKLVNKNVVARRHCKAGRECLRF
jgi:PIN domain nuclease of toxin-antitoxin system